MTLDHPGGDYNSRNRIGRIAVDGQITELPVPTLDPEPWGIACGPDGSLWFTERNGNQIIQMTTTGQFKEFPIPTPDSVPMHIAPGPDGAMWFTELDVPNISRVTMSGVFTEIPLAGGVTQTMGVTAGPGRTIWFTTYTGDQVGVLRLRRGDNPRPQGAGAPYGGARSSRIDASDLRNTGVPSAMVTSNPWWTRR